MSIENVTFKTFCELCTEISEAERDRKAEFLIDFIEKWREEAKYTKWKIPENNSSLYPVLRFLLPQLDRDRGAYGVKENTLAKIYIRILCLPKNGNDAIKLLEYRAPKSAGNQAGDFAEVVYWILKSRCSKGGILTIGDVNNHLDAIAAKHANNDPRGVDMELITLLRETSAEEQRWIIRIILKDMKLGLGQNRIFGLYHPDAKDLYDSCNDLKKVCNVLTDPSRRLHEIGIEIFSPFRPMLSEECDITKVDTYFKRSQYFYVETKLDGERFQLHMNEGVFKYFSRNGHDYTSSYGKDDREGSLTPRLAKNIRQNICSVILDGEMMCWESESKSYITKGMNTDVKYLKENGRFKPCFCVFDILYLDGRVLTNQTLNERLGLLEDVITEEEGVISFVRRRRITSKEEVWDSLNEAIENREEGVVMKDFFSVYKPNVRKNGGWYKLKPEYADGLMDSLDLLILGGYYGGGRHRGNISHFLLGVAASENGAEKFYSVARVGSGYSMGELLEIQLKLEPNWMKVIPGTMPEPIEWTKEKPDVWIEPSKSFILQVKASEIMPSDSFRTGYTLRFPRVEKIRYDKAFSDCLTFKEFEEKRQAASGKLVKRDFDGSDENLIKPKTRKSPRSDISIGIQFKPADLSEVERTSDLLLGKEICVFSGFNGQSKSDVEKKIAQYGGTLVQNPGGNTYCVLAEEESNVRISNVIKCGLHDVIRTSWFISQLNADSQEISDLTPSVLLGTSKKTREKISLFYDEYGDHFTRFSTIEDLSYPFQIAQKMVSEEPLTIKDMCYLDVELFSGASPYSLFRCCVAYFDRFPVVGNVESGLLNLLEAAQIDFRFQSGTSTESITERNTHIVISDSDVSRLDEFLRLNRERKNKLHIVTQHWITDCLSEKTLKSEDEYHPNALSRK